MKHPRIAEAVLALRPGARFSVNADDSDELVFYDETVPPTEAEIIDAINLLPPENQSLANRLEFHKDVFKAFALLMSDEINTLRSQHGLPERTVQQLKNAIVAKMDSMS